MFIMRIKNYSLPALRFATGRCTLARLYWERITAIAYVKINKFEVLKTKRAVFPSKDLYIL